ncbi:MAG: addiction module protein [Sulfuricella sp.]
MDYGTAIEAPPDERGGNRYARPTEYGSLFSTLPLEDGYIRQLWAAEARARRDDVRNGVIKTIPGQEVLERVRKSVAR